MGIAPPRVETLSPKYNYDYWLLRIANYSIMLPATRTHIQLAPRVLIDLAHFRHALLGLFGGDEARAVLILQLRKLAHFLADLHRAEFGAAHAAEMGGLGALRRERLVVILLGGVGVEAQVELVAPAEFEARFR